jgi:hypothetical protein
MLPRNMQNKLQNVLILIKVNELVFNNILYLRAFVGTVVLRIYLFIYLFIYLTDTFIYTCLLIYSFYT